MSAVSSTLDGAGLLAAYRPGASSVFASPRGTLLAEGARAVATTVPEAESLLRAGARIVLGAAPFTLNSPAHPARLVVPVNLRRAEAVGARAAAPAARPVVPAIPDDAYLAAVARAVADIGAGAYTKVVLARTLRIAAPGFDPAPVVRALAAAGSYTFGVDLGAGRTLLGASPELLVSRFGRTVSANPLAGSIPRSLDPAEDARRAAALLASAKDLREHAFASEAVAEGLRPFCRDLRVPSEPALTATPTMWHLGSRIRERSPTRASRRWPSRRRCIPRRRSAVRHRRPRGGRSPSWRRSTGASSPGWSAGPARTVTASGRSRSAAPPPGRTAWTSTPARASCPVPIHRPNWPRPTPSSARC